MFQDSVKLRKFYPSIYITDLLFMRCTYYYFKIVGLATINVRFKSIKKNKKIQSSLCTSSRLGILLNVVLVLIVIVIFGYSAMIIINMLYQSQSLKFDRIIGTTRIILGVTTAIVILITFCCKQESVAKIAHKIQAISVLSANFNREIGNKNESFSICRASGGIFLVQIIISLLAFVWIPEESWTVFVVAPFVSDIIMLSMLVQYSMTLNLVQRLMEIVNANILYTSQYSDKSEDINVIKNDRSENSFKKKFSKFSQLKDMHHLLCDVCEDLEKFYSRQALFCIAYIFESLILNSYFFTKRILKAGEKTLALETIFFFVVTMMRYITPLVNLTRSTTAVVAESTRTVKIVNRWFGNFQNQADTAMVNQFLNYLVQPNLEFTAGGLLVLNGSLLVSIAASITTYLMILLQVQDTKPN